MVQKVVIKDNKNAPLRYLPDLKNFKNGTVYEFKPGVNVIVGENGSGKTTLLNIIKKYLLVDYTECSVGEFNSNLHIIVPFALSDDKKKIYDGIDVYADYDKNTFRLCHAGERKFESSLQSFETFGTAFTQMHASTGEGVNIALNSLFKHIFSNKVQLKFNYEQFKESEPLYYDYIQKHRPENIEDEYTLLLDEPDRNLDIFNVKQIQTIFGHRKEQTQVIGVIHNPLLIYYLSKKKHVNFIELTPDYVNNVKKAVDKLIK